jgi:hypothetical protein
MPAMMRKAQGMVCSRTYAVAKPVPAQMPADRGFEIAQTTEIRPDDCLLPSSADILAQ